ncbi:MAG: hypothetical protein ACI4PF_07090 [Christensenellales bacterium]
MMRKSKIIQQELSSKVPDLKDKIESNIDWQNIKIKNSQPMTKTSKHSNFSLKFAFGFACVIVLVCLSVILPVYLKKDKTSNYNLILSVNPIIKFVVNENDIIVEQYGLNEDGVILLYSENYIGNNIDTATQEILNKLKDLGFISDTIKLSVSNSSGKILTKKQNELINIIDNYLIDENINTLILDEEEIEKLIDYYEDHNINEYSINFITKFKNKLIEVANNKLSDIANLVEELEPYAIDSELIISDFDKQNEVEQFCTKYSCYLDLDWNDLKYEDILDFCEELNEYREELLESLEEINEFDGEDYDDLLEDLFDLVKEELFEEN